MRGHNQHGNDSTTRTTITIPEDLKAQVNNLAIQQGISISATVVQIIRDYFHENRKIIKCGQEQN
jgi:metal-responsive CopG/Arc/MetJ family transcriptional regulator